MSVQICGPTTFVLDDMIIKAYRQKQQVKNACEYLELVKKHFTQDPSKPQDIRKIYDIAMTGGNGAYTITSASFAAETEEEALQLARKSFEGKTELSPGTGFKIIKIYFRPY